jgi:hypothetical protein
MAGDRDGRRDKRNERASQFLASLEDPFADERTRAQQRRRRAAQPKRLHGGFGYELVAPGEWECEIKAQGAASVGQLNWRRRQRFDQRVCPNYENRQLVWR